MGRVVSRVSKQKDCRGQEQSMMFGKLSQAKNITPVFSLVRKNRSSWRATKTGISLSRSFLCESREVVCRPW